MSAHFAYTFDRLPGTKFLSFKDERGGQLTLVHELTWTSYGKTTLELSLHRLPAPEGHPTSLAVAEIWPGGESCHHLCVCRPMAEAADFRFPSIDSSGGSDSWTCLLRLMPLLHLRDVEDWTSEASQVVSPPASEEVTSRLEQMSADWNRILLSGDLSDVVLESGATRIPAHKVVLAARSPVFCRMFQDGMRESYQSSVVIPDLAGEVLKELVSFMYTGSVKIGSVELAKGLYAAADKYAVQELKALCSGFMVRRVTCDDVLELLALADLHGDAELKKASLDFVASCFAELKMSERWESFASEKKDLAIEVLSSMLDKRV